MSKKNLTVIKLAICLWFLNSYMRSGGQPSANKTSFVCYWRCHLIQNFTIKLADKLIFTLFKDMVVTGVTLQ